jgi:RNA polymerase sigma-70 factor (ECF subfamily)
VLGVDGETIDLARRGDRPAQARLLTSLQDVWYRFCLSMLRDADRAADATQETGLRFLKQISSFRGESQLQTWSLGIALNVVREIRRRRIVGDDSSLEQLTTDLRSAERSSVGLVANPSTERLEDAELKDALRSTMSTLPDRQREAVVLRFFEELSVEQTAEIMGCATGTVKATVHQALRALREKMKQLK